MYILYTTCEMYTYPLYVNMSLYSVHIGSVQLCVWMYAIETVMCSYRWVVGRVFTSLTALSSMKLVNPVLTNCLLKAC